jgi:choline kinase
LSLPALILAAGNGSRLLDPGGVPKPLVKVAGLPLIDHIIGALVEAGVERVQIVTGHHAEFLQAHRYAWHPRRGIGFSYNPRHEEPNGLSLLAAEPELHGPFLLLMADHLFDSATLLRLLELPRSNELGALAVDRKLDAVFDLEDATRVETRDREIVAIGKGLAVFDAVDTGLFLLPPAVFPAMRESLAKGDATLSGGIRVLARRGRMRPLDVGAAAWIDVDTAAARDEAERLVLAGRVGRAPVGAV